MCNPPRPSSSTPPASATDAHPAPISQSDLHPPLQNSPQVMRNTLDILNTPTSPSIASSSANTLQRMHLVDMAREGGREVCVSWSWDFRLSSVVAATAGAVEVRCDDDCDCDGDSGRSSFWFWFWFEKITVTNLENRQVYHVYYS
jgi:hypothetical protein